MVSPNTLTDGVPKATKGYSEGFWHFWHPFHNRVFEEFTTTYST
jgi:hypothetical protein